MVKQKTPLGTLVARSDADPNYPGVSIYLRRGKHEELLVHVECDAYKNGVAFYAWFDAQGGEYSHGGALSEAAIKQMFEED